MTAMESSIERDRQGGSSEGPKVEEREKEGDGQRPTGPRQSIMGNRRQTPSLNRSTKRIFFHIRAFQRPPLAFRPSGAKARICIPFGAYRGSPSLATWDAKEVPRPTQPKVRCSYRGAPKVYGPRYIYPWPSFPPPMASNNHFLLLKKPNSPQWLRKRGCGLAYGLGLVGNSRIHSYLRMRQYKKAQGVFSGRKLC